MWVCVCYINSQYFKINFSQKFEFPASLEKSGEPATFSLHFLLATINYGEIAAVSLDGAHVLQFTKIPSLWLDFSFLCYLLSSECIWISNP